MSWEIDYKKKLARLRKLCDVSSPECASTFNRAARNRKRWSKL